MSRVICCLLLLLSIGLLPGELFTQQETPATLVQKAKKVLAPLQGEIATPGLKEPVEVLRDKWGVPHIYAKNTHDLFFAQGFVAAQDRLFQIDWWRRVGLGETAEVLGKKGLAGDSFARLIKYRGDMEAEWKSYSPDTKEIATAFTDGINAWIDQLGKDRLPIEFQILGHTPKKWQPQDVLGRMSGMIMTGNFEREVFRAQLIAEVGLKNARLLAPTDPPTDFAPMAGLDLAGIGPEIFADFHAASKAPEFRSSMTESNNWVISGERSASGKPLLANDPHRTIAVPSLRYLVHLNAPGWNVIGAGEPALPGVAVGHNDHVAWGFTIVGTDQADLFVEELNPEDHDEYKVGQKWEKVKIIRETVKVKGEAKPVEAELRFTRHGPILHVDKKSHGAFALKWVGSEPGSAAYLGSLALGRADGGKGFANALKNWKSPGLNMVFADVDGNYGWVAAGLVPVRKGYYGVLPVSGNSACEWDRFLEVKELPQEFAPKRGWIATANHNILKNLKGGYPHHIGYDWDPGYRFSVIAKRLQGKNKFTLTDMQSIQHEVTSLPGKILVELAKQVEMKDANLEKYAKVLRQWDGVLSAEAQAGPLYSAWLTELFWDFFPSRLPKKLHASARFLSVKVMLDALQNPEEKWFGKDPKAARDELLRKTFTRAVATITKKLGDDAAPWAWGKLHTVTFRHPLAALGTDFAKTLNLGPLPQTGDAYTPHNTRYNDKFEQIHGASYRQIFDLSDWDKGLATSTPGQSGQPGSPHYDDLLPLWGKEQYFPLAFSRKKVDQVSQHRLMLMPKQ